jgi:cobalamin-dependent methionine synthase I
MLIVGERINASRKPIAAAISAQDVAFIKKEAVDQKNAGAHLIDANAGIFVDEEVRYLKWLVQTIQEVVDISVCIDSPNQGDRGSARHPQGPRDDQFHYGRGGPQSEAHPHHQRV